MQVFTVLSAIDGIGRLRDENIQQFGHNSARETGWISHGLEMLCEVLRDGCYLSHYYQGS